MNKSVYIEEGCICCQACVFTAPDFFSFPDDRALVTAEVRVDGITSSNINERSPIKPEYEDWDLIKEAAAGCPVDIIKIV